MLQSGCVVGSRSPQALGLARPHCLSKQGQGGRGSWVWPRYPGYPVQSVPLVQWGARLGLGGKGKDQSLPTLGEAQAWPSCCWGTFNHQHQARSG